MKVDTFRI